MQEQRCRDYKMVCFQRSYPPFCIGASPSFYLKAYAISQRKNILQLLSEYKELSRQFWGRHIWGRGYFAASSGNVTDEVIMEYIATQDLQKNDGDFHISP